MKQDFCPSLQGSDMNKKEAAEFLGKSARSLADYAAQGKLKVTYVQGKNGREAMFDQEDLKRFKEEMETPIARSVSVPAASENLPAVIRPEQQEKFLAALQSIAHAPGLSLQELNVKPILQLVEVQRLTGIPRERLMAAIRESKLKAAQNVWGRGWRVKRADLDAFIAQL